MKHLSLPNYRADIDGLRAIAVVSVVVFHTFPSWMKGGFIGVDVFFVISGYLISTILFENLNNGTFRFFEFYSRRIKRIFPSLLLVLIVGYIAGWFVLFADEYRQLSKHIVGGASFTSNFILLRESGYFDNDAETKPFLHLWSLGVEEQFYIVYPVLLWLAWKKKFNILYVTLLVAITSFYLNMSGVNRDAIATFYSPQTRFWELMCGSLLAWLMVYKKETLYEIKSDIDVWLTAVFHEKSKNSEGSSINNLSSLIGMLLIVYGCVRIEKNLDFPGVWSLIPVLGSVLIILSGQQAWINKHILASRILVWIGLISFPLYLWHWLLLSLTRIIQGDTPDITIRIVTIFISILIALVTYKFIEIPIRSGDHGKHKTVTLLLIMIIIGFVGYITYKQNGFDFRNDVYAEGRYNGDIGHVKYLKHMSDKYFLCTPEEIANNAPVEFEHIRCMQSMPAQRVDVALIGDSHAEHLFVGIADALPDKNVAYYIRSSPPFMNNPDFKKIYATLAEMTSLKTVVLTMHWISKIDQVPADSTLDSELIKIIDFLSGAGKNIYLIDDVPTFPFDPTKCVGRFRFTNDTLCNIPYSLARIQKNVYINHLNHVVNERPFVQVLSVEKYICEHENCSMLNGNLLLYRDAHHLNINGSSFVGRSLVEDNARLFNADARP